MAENDDVTRCVLKILQAIKSGKNSVTIDALDHILDESWRRKLFGQSLKIIKHEGYLTSYANYTEHEIFNAALSRKGNELITEQAEKTLHKRAEKWFADKVDLAIGAVIGTALAEGIRLLFHFVLW